MAHVSPVATTRGASSRRSSGASRHTTFSGSDQSHGRQSPTPTASPGRDMRLPSVCSVDDDLGSLTASCLASPNSRLAHSSSSSSIVAVPARTRKSTKSCRSRRDQRRHAVSEDLDSLGSDFLSDSDSDDDADGSNDVLLQSIRTSGVDPRSLGAILRQQHEGLSGSYVIPAPEDQEPVLPLALRRTNTYGKRHFQSSRARSGSIGSASCDDAGSCRSSGSSRRSRQAPLPTLDVADDSCGAAVASSRSSSRTSSPVSVASSTSPRSAATRARRRRYIAIAVPADYAGEASPGSVGSSGSTGAHPPRSPRSPRGRGAPSGASPASSGSRSSPRARRAVFTTPAAAHAPPAGNCSDSTGDAGDTDADPFVKADKAVAASPTEYKAGSKLHVALWDHE